MNEKEVQLSMIKAAKAMGLDTSCLESFEYSPDRMAAIIETFLLNVPQKDMEIILDKRLSDSDAWNLNFYLSMGKTAEEYIYANDVELC